MQDTRTPVYVAIGTILLNIILGYVSVTWTKLGAQGLALAFSVANNLEALTLLLLLLRRLGGIRESQFLRSFVGSGVSAGVMGVILLLFISVSRSRLPMITLAGAYGARADAFRLLAWLAVAGMLGALIYLGTSALIGVAELRDAWSIVRRRRSARGPA
jgi:putative peptidoglycan lipid II flippase